MKKLFTLGAVMLLTASSMFAQQVNKSNLVTTSTMKQKNATVIKNNTVASTTSVVPTTSSSLAVISSWDFNGSMMGWTASTGAGGISTGPSANWMFTTTGPAGSFLIPDILSTTAANGYLIFDSDVNCNGDQHAIVTSPVINCATHPAVKLKFQQQYRRFFDSTFVDVSNNGTTWTTYEVNGGLTNNDFSGDNPTVTGINISAIAGGQATVYIRFRFSSHDWTTTTAEGCGYSWMIDDVVVEDLPANDLITLLTGDVTNYMIPLNHIQPITYAGLVSNIGAASQTNTVLSVNCKNAVSGASVFTASSTPVNLLPSIDSSLSCTGTYTPTMVGSYLNAYNASNTPAVDAYTPDNVDTTKFMVSDSTFQSVSQIQNTGFLMDDINGGLNKCGFVFTLNADDTVTSLVTALWEPGFTNTANNVPLSAEIYSIDGAGALVLKAATNIRTLTAAQLSFTTAAPNIYVDVPLTFAPQNITPTQTFKGAALTAGTYLALFVSAGNTDTIAIVGGDTPLFAQNILQDETEAVFDAGGIYGKVNFGNVAYTITGIEDDALSANINVLPNPANNFVNINIANTSNATVTLVDATGKVIDTKLNVNAATSFNLAALANGIYFVNVAANNAVATKRIVVAH
jgi:hypothetical protein